MSSPTMSTMLGLAISAGRVPSQCTTAGSAHNPTRMAASTEARRHIRTVSPSRIGNLPTGGTDRIREMEPPRRRDPMTCPLCGSFSLAVPSRTRHPPGTVNRRYSGEPSIHALVATSGCCGNPVRDPGPIRKILTHLGEPFEPPPVSAAGVLAATARSRRRARRSPGVCRRGRGVPRP